MSHYRWDGNRLFLSIRLTPKASRDKVGELLGDQLKIAITSPPIDGKANAHLIKLLAKAFRVPKSQVCLESGESHRNKVVSIEAPAEVPLEFQVTSPRPSP